MLATHIKSALFFTLATVQPINVTEDLRPTHEADTFWKHDPIIYHTFPHVSFGVLATS